MKSTSHSKNEIQFNRGRPHVGITLGKGTVTANQIDKEHEDLKGIQVAQVTNEINKEAQRIPPARLLLSNNVKLK